MYEDTAKVPVVRVTRDWEAGTDHCRSNPLLLCESIHHELGKEQWSPERSPRLGEFLDHLLTLTHTLLSSDLAHIPQGSRSSSCSFHVLIVQ